MELKNLLNVISQHEQLLSELLVVLGRETTQMSSVDTAAMSDSDRLKEELIAKINLNSTALQKAISDVAVREGLASKSMLKTIAQQMAARGNRELLVRQEKLFGLVARVRQVSDLNREIAECFADSVATSLDLISRMINQSSFYGASGSYQRRSAGAMLVNREA
ncbi:MAG TPA: hypothetical protein HPP76_03075 [Desulfuromonadales bacterium]|nr:hypothetical protein [Desulfuromonadales bacterium]